MIILLHKAGELITCNCTVHVCKKLVAANTFSVCFIFVVVYSWIICTW